MRPILEDTQTRLGLTRCACVQGRREGAHGGFGVVAGKHRFLKIVAGRLVVFIAMTLEPGTQLHVVHRRQLDVSIDDAQRLEDHPLADGGIALVDSERQTFAIQHLVVQPNLAQDIEFVLVGLAASGRLEHLPGLVVDGGIHDDRARIVDPTVDEMIDGEQQATQQEKVQ